ncbi:MAG: 6,7-dimethyl-8-ribityllumazine synthase [Puniceicoccales bacterium]|jgi:6,7-dimethyl-8-ribityllumazine synthase|nr:6,7-dimethyl-8-ribityllumazine synthase [Puniceicoccales bacterium]
MSQDKPTIPLVDGTDLSFAVVAARYNNDLVETLLKRVRATLRKARVSDSSIKVLRVPGAAELPYVANMLAQTSEYACVIVLGVIIAGETNHHEVLANSTAVALQGIALQSEVPVINGILTVNSREQAEARASGELDRGAEFANAALEMAWHHVQLGDYLDALDAEAEREEQAHEADEFSDFDDDGDSDDFGTGRSPFQHN